MFTLALKSLLYGFSFGIIFLQIELPREATDHVIDHVLRVSPYNAMAYGLLVGASWFMTWVFYRNWKQSEEYNKRRDEEVLKFNKESLELMIKVETRLTDNTIFSGKLGDIVYKASSLVEKMERLLQRIEEERSNM